MRFPESTEKYRLTPFPPQKLPQLVAHKVHILGSMHHLQPLLRKGVAKSDINMYYSRLYMTFSSTEMLPSPTSIDFPSALKARREVLGLSRAALARKSGKHEVMIRRYEEPEVREFAKPRADTWLALNIALGYEVPDETYQAEKDKTEEEAIQSTDSGSISQTERQHGSSTSSATFEEVLLQEASLEDIVRLLHSRNIEPTFRYLIPS